MARTGASSTPPTTKFLIDSFPQKPEREAILAQALPIVYAAHGKNQPSAEDFDGEIAAWLVATARIPLNDLAEAILSCLANRAGSSKFMLRAVDVADYYRTEMCERRHSTHLLAAPSVPPELREPAPLALPPGAEEGAGREAWKTVGMETGLRPKCHCGEPAHGINRWNEKTQTDENYWVCPLPKPERCTFRQRREDTRPKAEIAKSWGSESRVPDTNGGDYMARLRKNLKERKNAGKTLSDAEMLILYPPEPESEASE